MKILFVALTFLALPRPILAHASLSSSDPQGNSVMTELPTEVSLTMSEAVELKFSIFKVYRLESPPEDKKELLAAIKSLMDEKLMLRDDGEARADDGLVTTESRSDVIKLKHKAGLEPGMYVVMWRLLSVDTHATQDFTFFIYDPAATSAASGN